MVDKEYQSDDKFNSFLMENSKEHEVIRLKHAELAKDVEKIGSTTCRIEKKMDTFIGAADQKFAPIWVAKALTWGGAVVGGSLLLAVVSQVIK